MFISGARQSVGAHALWRALGKCYELFHVELRDKRLRYLGHRVDERIRQDLHTRMILLGRDWDRDRLAACTGMLNEARLGAVSPKQRPLFRRY